MGRPRLHGIRLTAESETGAFGPCALPQFPVEEGDVIEFAGSIEIGAPPRSGPKANVHQLTIRRGGQKIAVCRLCGAVCAGAHNPGTSCRGELHVTGPDPRHIREHPHHCDEHMPQDKGNHPAAIPQADCVTGTTASS